MYSSRDLLYDLIVKIRLTRKTAAAAGHVVNIMKPIVAAIEKSSTTNVPSIKKIIGDNAIITEDIEIKTILPKMLGRSTNRCMEFFLTYLSLHNRALEYSEGEDAPYAYLELWKLVKRA